VSARPLKVIVIGAGTGGLGLAHGLRRAGIGVAVYERDRTRVDGLQAYRVGIDPDGSRALHTCLPPELFDTFVATCAPTPDRFNVFTERREEVLSLDGFARSGARPGWQRALGKPHDPASGAAGRPR
jgi:2-polyprenyl-6-methoxyphenol hydroxylase-like FAD-dependent oxidoreductase